MKNQKYIIGGAIVLIAILLWAIPFNKEEKTSESTTTSGSAIDFPLEDESGNSFNLNEYQGKTIVLNFWASWCAPCIQEMPSIQEYYDNVDKDEIKVVLVALDNDFNKSINFMNKNNYSMPYYKPQGDLPQEFEVSAIPTTYIINGNGEVEITHTGMSDFTSDEFKQAVQEVD